MPADDEIERISRDEGRIVLTRDRDLLKRRGVTHGCYVRALRSAEQLREVFDRLDLARSARPFTLCLHCNAPLHPIDKALAAPALPLRVSERYQRFSTCDICRRIFWEGTHWQRMRAMVEAAQFEGRAITLSLGVAEFPADASTGEKVIAVADKALYEAKRSGRNRVVRAKPAGRKTRATAAVKTPKRATVKTSATKKKR